MKIVTSPHWWKSLPAIMMSLLALECCLPPPLSPRTDWDICCFSQELQLPLHRNYIQNLFN